MKHFPEDDRYEFYGHALGDRRTGVMVTVIGQPGKELYDRFIGVQDADGYDMAAEDKVDLDIDDRAVTFLSRLSVSAQPPGLRLA